MSWKIKKAYETVWGWRAMKTKPNVRFCVGYRTGKIIVIVDTIRKAD